MHQISIYKNSELTNQAAFETVEEANAWLDKHIKNNTFGLAEHQREVTPAEFDEEGKEISPATYETVPSEYEVEIKDISEEVNQQKINTEARAYLNQTDWYITRNVEAGVEVLEEIKTLRAAARASIK